MTRLFGPDGFELTDAPAATFNTGPSWANGSPTQMLEDLQKVVDEIRNMPPPPPMPLFVKVVDWLPKQNEDGTIEHWRIQFEHLLVSKEAHEAIQRIPEGGNLINTLRNLT